MIKRIPLGLMSMIFLVAPILVYAQDNASLNYVWNESCTSGDPDECFIPWLGTFEGVAKVEVIDSPETSTWSIAMMLGLISLSGLFFYIGHRAYESNTNFFPIKLVSYMMGGLTLWTTMYIGSVITSSENSAISQIILRVWTGLTYIGSFILFLILIFFIVRILRDLKLKKKKRIEEA